MLQEKVVAMTGAHGGIGRDFAPAMAAEDANVVGNDIDVSLHGEGRDAGPTRKVVDGFYPLDRSQDVFSRGPL